MGSFACMYIGAMLLQFQNRPEEGAGSFGTGVTDTSGLGCDQNQYGSSAGINVLNPEHLSSLFHTHSCLLLQEETN